MIEKGHKVNPELLTKIYGKAKDIDGGLCAEDREFYKAYIGNGTALVKKPYKVFVEVDVEAFDEKFAKKEAAETLGIHFGESIKEYGKVKVVVKAV
jgi:hypothetical protein